MTARSHFIPDIFKDPNALKTQKSDVTKEIKDYISSCFEKTLKHHKFEVFETEDINTDIMSLVHELQNTTDNCVKKTGDTVTGPLHLLKSPVAEMDVVNKHYVDTLISEKLATKYSRNCDLNINHFKIVNVQTPQNLSDAVNKNYVDEKFEQLIALRNPTYHIFSKGQTLAKKTFYFNPGFVCPHKIHITSVGFTTSPYKYKIGEKLKTGEINPTKLYFMINQEIRSEHVIEKDVQLGYVLKEFSEPIIIEKGDNLMMVVENVLDDSSVNLTFY
jgi:hypothetical protein